MKAETEKKSGRGGARSGTGPKVTATGELTLTALKLDKATREGARKIGGTISEGIRLAVAHALECEKIPKSS